MRTTGRRSRDHKTTGIVKSTRAAGDDGDTVMVVMVLRGVYCYNARCVCDVTQTTAGHKTPSHKPPPAGQNTPDISIRAKKGSNWPLQMDIVESLGGLSPREFFYPGGLMSGGL